MKDCMGHSEINFEKYADKKGIGRARIKGGTRACRSGSLYMEGLRGVPISKLHGHSMSSKKRGGYRKGEKQRGCEESDVKGKGSMERSWKIKNVRSVLKEGTEPNPL